MAPEVTLQNGLPVKLGRIPPKLILDVGKFRVVQSADGSKRIMPRLSAYYLPSLDKSPPPEKVDWFAEAMESIGRVYLNDQYGDCVIAGKYHQLGIWSGNDKPPAIQASDQEVWNSYQTICGRGDNGCDISTVLDWWKTRGLIAGGNTYKIDDYVAIDHTNADMVRVALQVFGAITLGINLPSAWTVAPGTWDVTNTHIVGGHDVCGGGYDSKGVQIATWGKICTITWAAFTDRRWIEECYCALSPNWYNDDNLAPNGIDVAALRRDLDTLKGGQIPNIDPTPPAPPQPPGPPSPPPGPAPNPSPFVIWLEMIIQELQSIPNLPVNLQKLLAWALALLAMFGIKR